MKQLAFTDVLNSVERIKSQYPDYFERSPKKKKGLPFTKKRKK